MSKCVEWYRLISVDVAGGKRVQWDYIRICANFTAVVRSFSSPLVKHTFGNAQRLRDRNSVA